MTKIPIFFRQNYRLQLYRLTVIILLNTKILKTVDPTNDFLKSLTVYAYYAGE